MADIVERLRSVTEEDAYALPWTFGETCKEAADEIEQLRRALEKIAAQKLTSEIGENELVANDIEGTHDAMILTARAALSEKEAQ